MEHMANPHAALGLQESLQAEPDAFTRWVANAELILGHDLDGSDEKDGYSIDAAHAAFQANVHSADYAARVLSAQLELAWALKAVTMWSVIPANSQAQSWAIWPIPDLRLARRLSMNEVASSDH